MKIRSRCRIADVKQAMYTHTKEHVAECNDIASGAWMHDLGQCSRSQLMLLVVLPDEDTDPTVMQSAT